MAKYCIVLTDASRARLYWLESSTEPYADPPRLEEVEDLVSPESRLSDSELFDNSRPGLRKSSARGGPTHAVDDRRDQAIDENERKFASQVIEAAERLATGRKAHHLVLAASPNMLGRLRQYLDQLTRHDFQVHELDKDLTQLSPAKAHDYLAEKELLPKRERLTMP